MGRNNSRTGIKGVTIGLLVGGALGAMFSPQSGKRNREKLKDNLIKASDKLKDIAENINTDKDINYINIENEEISEDGEVFINEKYKDDVDID